MQSNPGLIPPSVVHARGLRTGQVDSVEAPSTRQAVDHLERVVSWCKRPSFFPHSLSFKRPVSGPARGEGTCRERQTDRETDRKRKGDRDRRGQQTLPIQMGRCSRCSRRIAAVAAVAASLHRCIAASLRLSVGFLPDTIECWISALMTDGGLPRQQPQCATLPAGGQYRGGPALGARPFVPPCAATLLHACCPSPSRSHPSCCWNDRTTLALINAGVLDWGRPRDCRAGARRPQGYLSVISPYRYPTREET